MELTVKERRIIKANDRINRLTIERSEMIKNSTQWHAKTRQIGQEKELIRDLREGSAALEDHFVRAANAEI